MAADNDNKDEKQKPALPADKPSSGKTEAFTEEQIPGIKSPTFVRGEWKRELTSEEIEKKQKRSEAAKRAAETRRRKRLEAEAAARAAIPEDQVAVRSVKGAAAEKPSDEGWQPQQIKWEAPEKPSAPSAPVQADAPEKAEVPVSAPKEREAVQKERGLPPTDPALKKAKEKILAAAAEKEVRPSSTKAPHQTKAPAPKPQAEKAAGPVKQTGEKAQTHRPLKKRDEPAASAAEAGEAKRQAEMPQAPAPAAGAENKKEERNRQSEPSAAQVFFKKAGAVCAAAGKKTASACRTGAKKAAAVCRKAGKACAAAGRKLAAACRVGGKKAAVLCKKAGQAIARGWRAFLKKAGPWCKRFGRGCRKGYRFIRLKLHPLMVKLGAVFYRIGFHTEYILVLCGRWIKKELLKTWRFIWKLLVYAAKPFAAFFKGAWETVSAPFIRLYSGFAGMVRAYREARPLGRRKAWAEALKHVGRGIRSYHHLMSNLLMWGVAVAALAVFITTVYVTLNQQYILQVMVDGKSVGFVKSEEVFDKAYENVQGQIVYTRDDDEKWNIQPVYHLVRQGDIAVSNEVDVTESILRNSGEELSEAFGLYIDGAFYGAVKDAAAINATLEELKGPYQAQYPGASIQFVQDVQLKNGLYLTKSLADERQLCDMLASETEGTGVYIIQKGDTLSGIGGMYGVSQSELFRLNPQLENGEATYYPGDQLVVSMAKHFLQVKAVVTSIEEESIPYTTQATENSEKMWNVFNVLQEGENGAKNVTYQRTYIDGNMTEEVKLEEVVIREPVTRITEKGTKTPDNKPIVTGNGWIFPVPSNHGLSRGFSGGHPALDIQASYGSPIVASRGGVVVKATFTSAGYGWHVAIDHGDGYYSLYAHCSALAVAPGQSVSQGDVIGYVGSTGWSTGNHCHFEIRIGSLGGNYRGCVDPAPYVM